MEKYTALRKSSTKKDYTKFTVISGILIIIYSLYRSEYAFAIIGAVVIYVALYSKDVIIDDTGLTTYYHAIFYNKTKNYPFTDFTELRVQKNVGPETIIGFVRNGMNTNCIFTPEDAEAVIQLAKKHNPKLYIRELEVRRRKKF